MQARSEGQIAPAHPAKVSSEPRKRHGWDFRAALKTVAKRARDGEWVTRSRQLHS